MRFLFDFQGGRNLLNDDLEVIQEQLDAMPALVAALGPFVLSGCAVTLNAGNYDVAAGYIVLNGKVFKVAAQTGLNLSSPGLMFGEAAETTEANRPYTLLSTQKDGIKKRNLQVLATTSTSAPGENLFILSTGMRSLREALRDLTIPAGTIQMFSGLLSDTAKFDGLGKGLGVLRGWHAANGSGGTIDLKNRFIVGAGDEYAPGDVGGAKEVTLTGAQSGVAEHSHAMETLSGSAGASSVYLTAATGGTVNVQATTVADEENATEAHENRPPYYALIYLQYIGTSNLYKIV